MVFRDKIAFASCAASIAIASGFLLAPAQAAGSAAPLRAPLLAPPRSILQQAPVSRAWTSESDTGPFAASSGETPAVVLWGNSRNIAIPVDQTDFDIAEALVTDEQRALASALEPWIDRAHSAERRKQRKAIAALYAGRGFEAFWRDGAGWRAEAVAVAQRLKNAPEDGLDLRFYRFPQPDQDATSIEGELDLSEAVVAYAAQAAGGRVDPQKVSRLISAKPSSPEPSAILPAVATAGPAAGDALQDSNPPHAGYRALRAKLAELRSSRAQGDLQLAKAQTASLDDRSAPGADIDSIAAARRSHAHIEAEIIANMERWRWLPRDLGDSRIEVNIPDFQLSVLRDGAVAHRARVIVGKEKTPTPIFSNRMQFIIVNPYWNVPPSILNKEMLPKHNGDLAAIEQSGFEVLRRHGQVFVRQRPGERNALGRIKFMFPNDFSVYLHDTPSRALFAAAHRAFSHGCVRVDQPFRLAEAVLGPGSGWPEERVRKLIGGSERYINLAKPLPIHIEYFTAYVDEQGSLQLRGDLYGYSARVRAALGLEG